MFNTHVNLGFNELIINFMLMIKYSVFNIHFVSVRDLLLKEREGDKMRVVELSALCAS